MIPDQRQKLHDPLYTPALDLYPDPEGPQMCSLGGEELRQALLQAINEHPLGRDRLNLHNVLTDGGFERDEDFEFGLSSGLRRGHFLYPNRNTAVVRDAYGRFWIIDLTAHPESVGLQVYWL
jgi:hypothetical protein